MSNGDGNSSQSSIPSAGGLMARAAETAAKKCGASDRTAKLTGHAAKIVTKTLLGNLIIIN